MLIALLIGYLIFGGSGGGGLWLFGGQTTHQLHKEVAKLEPDKEKRKAVDDTVDQIEQAYKSTESERAKLEKDALAAFEQHDASGEQFRPLATQADTINANVNKSLLDLRFQLRSELSDAQWRQLFPAPASSK